MKSPISFLFILFFSIVHSLSNSEYNCIYNLAQDIGTLSSFGDPIKGYTFCNTSTLLLCNSDSVILLNLQYAVSNKSFILTPSYFDCFSQLGTLSISLLNISSDFIYQKIKNVNLINFDRTNVTSISNYIPYYKQMRLSFLPGMGSIQLKYLQNVYEFDSIGSVVEAFINDGTIPQNKTLNILNIQPKNIPDLTNYESIQNLKITFPSTFNFSTNYNIKTLTKLKTLFINSNICYDFPLLGINQFASNSLESLYLTGCMKPLVALYSLKNISTTSNFTIVIQNTGLNYPNNNQKLFPFSDIGPLSSFSMTGVGFNITKIGSLFSNVGLVNLENNNIMTEFEPKIGSLPLVLDISNNLISGELDSSWCTTSIYLSNNKFTGDIPSCFYCYFDDATLEYSINYGNQFNPVTNSCTTIVPNLKVFNSQVIIYGTDLPLSTSQFTSEPYAPWFISTRSKQFQVSEDSIPASTETIDILIFNGKYKFTLAMNQTKPPIISNITFTSLNQVTIGGSYFTYNKSLVSFIVDSKVCEVTSSTFYEIQCSFNPSSTNFQGTLMSTLKIGDDRPSENVFIDTTISFVNQYCPQSCNGIGIGVCNMKQRVCIACPSNCSNRGICDYNSNQCICNYGYTNDDCSGIQCNPNDCNGHGNCNTTIGKCNCNIDWVSSDCNTTNHYVSSIISTSTSGGIVTLIGMFGDVHNDPSVKIGDLNCAINSINSTTIQCKIGAGKGFKTVEVTQNNITWKGNGFKYIETVLPCPSQCSSHGTCNTTTGICNCEPKWSGIDCAIEINIDSPHSNSTVDTDNGNSTITNGETQYSILITSINEIDFNGNSIKEIQLKNNWKFDSKKSTTGFYYFIQYLNSTNNNNNNNITIISTIEEVKQTKQYSFAGINFNVDAGSIKFTTTIKNWEYSSVLNTLQLRMSTTVDQIINRDDSCNQDTNISTNNYDDTLNYMTISKNGKVLYGRFIQKALSDSRPSYVTTEIIEKNENSLIIGLNLPHCVDECVVDPDYSVLVNPDFSSDCNSSDKNRWLIPVAVVVPVVGLSFLAVVFYVIYRKNSTIIKVHLFSKIKLKNMN